MKQLRFNFILLLASMAFAQTRINLQQQSRVVDFSLADRTKPVKTGIALPSTCSTGELYFLLTSTTGANLYACVATNIWAVQNGGLPTQRQPGILMSADGATAQWTLPGGDMSGQLDAAKVIGLQGRSVADIIPSEGDVLTWSSSSFRWQPRTPTFAGGVSVQANDVEVGSRSKQNFLAGYGIAAALMDTGAAINIQYAIDPAIVETRAGAQSGSSLVCSSAAPVGGGFRCGMNPKLASYTPQMIVHWIPAADASGSLTLNIDTLGARPLKRADGTSDPVIGDIRAGRMHLLWFDGTTFRLAAGATASFPSVAGIAKLDGNGGLTAATAGADYASAVHTHTVADVAGSMAKPTSTGMVAWEGASLKSRSITAGSGVSVVNGDGIAGDPQISVDTTVVPAHGSVQRNEALYLQSSSGSATAYTGCPARPIDSYAAGMLLYWQPDVNGSGEQVTINVCGQGALPVKRSDGAADPTAADIRAGELHALWYDGTVFRLLNTRVEAESVSVTGQGYLMPTGGPGTSATSVGVANRMFYAQFVPPVNATISRVGWYNSTLPSGKAVVHAIYDSQCSLLAYGTRVGSVGATAVSLALNTPVMLNAGKPYYYGFAAEDATTSVLLTANWLYHSSMLNAEGALQLRAFWGSEVPTGTGASFAPPKACGMRSNSGAINVPALVMFP